MSTPAPETAAAPAAPKVKMYAVFRNGFRVSDSEYDSQLSARGEYEYWNKLLKRWPDGSRLDIWELHYRRHN